MHNCRHRGKKAFIGIVARKIHEDVRAGGNRAGNLKVEHHFRIAAKRIERVRAGIVRAAAREGYNSYRRLPNAELLEISCQFSRAEAAIQFQDGDGLTRAIETRWKVIKRSNLD